MNYIVKSKLVAIRLTSDILRLSKRLFKKNIAFKDEVNFKLSYLKNLDRIYRSGMINRYSELKDYKKKSDTLFILGSGKSINEISSRQWSEIKKNYDSIGFNFWQMHSHVPDIYVFEPMFHNRWVTFIDNLELLKEEYKDIKLYAKDLMNNDINREMVKSWPNELRDNLIPLKVNHFSGHNLNNVLRVFKKSINKHKEHSKYDFFPQIKASVTLMMAIGIILGFKKIVLCGIDLNSKEYFWECESENLRNNLKKPSNFHGNDLKQHRTMSRGIPISEFIYSIADDCDDVHFFTSSRSSELSKKLDIYDLNWAEEEV